MLHCAMKYDSGFITNMTSLFTQEVFLKFYFVLLFSAWWKTQPAVNWENCCGQCWPHCSFLCLTLNTALFYWLTSTEKSAVWLMVTALFMTKCKTKCYYSKLPQNKTGLHPSLFGWSMILDTHRLWKRPNLLLFSSLPLFFVLFWWITLLLQNWSLIMTLLVLFCDMKCIFLMWSPLVIQIFTASHVHHGDKLLSIKYLT